MFAASNTNMYITKYIRYWIFSANNWAIYVSWGVSVDPSAAGLGNVHFVISNIFQLNFYRTQVSLGSDLWILMSLPHSLTTRLFADLTDVTLADEDSKSIPTDDVNKAILGNVAIQVAPSGGQQWNECKWHHLVAKLVTNSRSPNCWPNLQLVYVVLSGGQNWN